MTTVKSLLLAQLVCAALGVLLPWRKAARWAWLGVLPLSLATLTVRWINVGHPPMRNLFEAFLWIPLLLVVWPLVMRGSEKVETVRQDAALGILILIPLTFVFKETEALLMPALRSPFFVPHVLCYMVAYMLMARAFILSVRGAVVSSRCDASAGFFFMTCGLLLGAVWGNEIWGCYWQFDPKEQWSLGTWLIYAAWFHAWRFPRLEKVLLGLGLLAILLTVTWVNLSKLFGGVHSYAGL